MDLQSRTIWAPQIRTTLNQKYAISNAKYFVSDFETRKVCALSIPRIGWDVDGLFGGVLRGPNCLVDGLSDI